MNHYKNKEWYFQIAQESPFLKLNQNRPLKVFVVNSTASSVKNKKLFELSEFFLFSYEVLNFKKVSEVLTFLFRFCVKTKMKKH